jgi:cytochrome P450
MQTQLTINPYLIHRNPLDWKKPDDFIPERFDVNSPEYDPDRNAYSFVPFSAGPRK